MKAEEQPAGAQPRIPFDEAAIVPISTVVQDIPVASTMASISLNHVLNSVADAGLELFRLRGNRRASSPATPVELCRELLSTLGEASGVALARQIVEAYELLDDGAKLAFFRELRSGFHVDPDRILACAEEYRTTGDDVSLSKLQSAVESRRQELFRRINMAPEGTGMLVSLREDLLRHTAAAPELRPVDSDLAHLLASWFNRGFLSLRRIDWDTPASILEKIIAYESVHAITGWDDLRGRLAEDRRCFAFFHGALPDDPLIYVEVALVQGLSGSVQPLIDSDRPVLRPDTADTAIFYSINNCHRGLKGISFGNFLIKQVVLDLQREFPRLKTFATLSPIPMFRDWLSGVLDDPESGYVTDPDRERLKALDSPDWRRSESSLRPLLQRLAAIYFIEAKSGGFPYDPVARFHLRNGARLERINWRGDVSGNGMAQSAGMLVNYVYDLRAIETNHEDYVIDRNIAVAPAVKRLARS